MCYLVQKNGNTGNENTVAFLQNFIMMAWS